MGRAFYGLGQCGCFLRFGNYFAGSSECGNSPYTSGEKTIFKIDSLRDLYAADDSLCCSVFQYEDGMADVKGIMKI